MRNRTPWIPWIVCLAALAVTGLAIQPVIASTVDQTVSAIGQPATAEFEAMDLTLENGLAGALPVKVDAAVYAPKSAQVTFETKLLKLINAERAKRGLRKLTLNSRLSKASESHSKDMAVNNYFSHTGLDGSSFTDRISRTGYKWSAAGETLYAGGGPYNTPAACVKAWLNSPGHRAILLSKAYTQIGLGYVYKAGSTYGGYYTAEFAKPRK